MQALSPEAFDAALADALARGALAAVVDAARIDHLQDRLGLAGMDHDPLYLDEVDAPTIAAGPHLVRLRDAADVARLRAWADGAPAIVWWRWSGPAEGLRRHLRGLNMVEIPRARYDARNDAAEPGWKAVLFRHADPNVLMDVMQVLDPAQTARLLGEAEALLLDAPNYPAPVAVAAGDGPPTPRPGLLRIGHDQYEALGDVRRAVIRPRVEAYLRTATPKRAAAHDGPAFRAAVDAALTEGRRLGLRSSVAFSRLALMEFSTGGRTLDSARFRAAMESPMQHETPDGVLERVFGRFRKGA